MRKISNHKSASEPKTNIEIEIEIAKDVDGSDGEQSQSDGLQTVAH